MGRKPYDIDRVRTILTMCLTGTSHRDIADYVGCSASTVSNYKKLMNKANIVAAEQLKQLSDNDIARIIYHPNAVVVDSQKHQAKRVVLPRKTRITDEYLKPDYEAIASRIIDTHVTVQVCYRDYVDECKAKQLLPVSHTDFYNKVRLKKKSLLPKEMYMIQHYPLGQAIAIDWCGDKFSLNKDKKPYYICVFTWAATNYTFACFTEGQTTRCVCNAFAKAVKYFGCMPYLVIIDNAKSMVTKHKTGQDPIFNRSFENYMHDCHVSIEANNPRAPSSKSMVELSVRLIQDRVLKRMTENLPWSIDEYNTQLQKFIEVYINNEGFKNNCKGTSRATLFQEQEKPRASSVSCVLETFKEFMGIYTVDKSYTVTIEGVKYSVKYEHVGHSVRVIKDENLYKIYYGLDLIATHVIAPQGSLPVIKEEHMPDDHKAVHKKRVKYPNAQSLITAAHNFSPVCENYCRTVLSAFTFEERKSGLIKILNEYNSRDRRFYNILDETLKKMLAQGKEFWNNYSFEEISKELSIYALTHNGNVERQTELNFEDGAKTDRDNTSMGYLRYAQSTTAANDQLTQDDDERKLSKEYLYEQNIQ